MIGNCMNNKETKYQSERSIIIDVINPIKVICNIAQDSFVVGQPSHTIYEFTPTLEKGTSPEISPIIETPSNLVYYRLNTEII